MQAVMLWLSFILSVVSACDFPLLPNSLSKLAPSLEVTGSLSTFGRFLLDTNSTTWSFVLSKESLVRFAFDPVNVNLEATISTKTKTYGQKTTPVDSHGLITARLKSGTYALSLVFDQELREDERNEENSRDCDQPYLYLSGAILPLTDLQKLSKADLQNFASGFPALEFAEPMRKFEKYTLMDSSRFIDISTVDPGELVVLGQFPLEAQPPNTEEAALGHTGLWKVSFTVHHEFAELAGVALMMQKDSEEAPTSLSCMNTGNCVISHRYDKNVVSLVTAVTPGNYTLWVFYMELTDMEKTTLKEFQGGLIPFSVNFLIEPLIEREDRFNCEAGRLPVSLNSPGFMDKDGFLSYHDNVFVDLYSTCQQTHFSIPDDSLLRLVTVEPAGVGVDVKLLGVQGEVVALSQTIGGTEGIFLELPKGEYTLDFTFENTMISNPRHVFCETFLLELDIMPIPAAKAFLTAYRLGTCRDDTETLTNLLNENMKLLNDKKKGAFIVDPEKSNFFVLPIKSVANGDEAIFEYKFELDKSSYVYFEVLSHSILADLTVLLKRVLDTEGMEDVFGDFTDALSLERNSRRAFHGRVNAGQYIIVIKTGPGAKNKGPGRARPTITDENFAVVPRCVAFQLRAEVLGMTETRFNKWTCGGTNFSLVPNSMNTLDKLGHKGMNQPFLPKTVFFGQKLLPPNNKKSDDPESIAIFVEKESILRVSGTSETGGIVLVLQTGGKDLQRVGKKQLTPSESVSLGATLQANQAYTLRLYFYPLESSDCATYDLNLEIKTVESLQLVKSTQTCEEKLPTKDALVHYRTLEDLNPQFEMSSGEYSSSLHDSDFQYYHRKENGRITVPFEISSELAVVTAHMQTSFVESGLRFYIESEDGETAAYGAYESAHRMETYAVVLSSGKYSVVFEETGQGPNNLCNSFSAAVLVEAEDQWDSYDALLRKTNDCGFPDLPATLNIIGELEEGSLHWHRELPLDASNRGHRFPFKLEQTSIIHLAVEPVTDVSFFGRIFLVSKPPYKLITSKDATKGMHAKLQPGNYYLDLAYGSDSDLPQPSECEVFVLDLQIVPESTYLQLAQQNSCTSSAIFPSALTAKKSTETKYLFYTSSQYDKRAKIDLAVDSLLHFELSFEGALTGPLMMFLYNAQSVKVQTSSGVQDFASLIAAVPPGSYSLKIFSTTLSPELDPVCAKITFSFSIEETVLVTKECEGSDLPSKLYSEETLPYGGPQAKDGSVSFYGVFRIPENRMSDKLLIRVGEIAIARILTLSSTPGVYIEAMLYKDTKMTQVVGFSKSEGRAGSFILELEAKYEAYVLELVYVKHKTKLPCATFELAIEIELRDTVKEKLACNPKLSARMPESALTLSPKDSQTGEAYSIQSNWLIGDPATFPPGVISLGVKNGAFVYKIDLTVAAPGRLSAIAEFDFLTNDIYLQLLKGDKVLGKSSWLVVGEQLNEDLELASTLEEISLEAGSYTLVLRQAVAANHLVQLFDPLELCFPFLLSLDFQPPVVDSMDKAHLNKLVSVTPLDKTNINSSKGFALVISWELPVHKGRSGSFVKALYLETEKRIKIHPDTVRQEKSKPNKLELTFKSGQLPRGTCFTLKLNPNDLDLEDEDLRPELNLVGKHSYCTGNCACNPKAEAKCGEDLECICPTPYSGITCEECVPGYTFDKTTSLCVKDECVNCSGACINGVCQPTSVCDCGDHGKCAQTRCQCDEGFSGEKCNLCKNQDLVFPYCTPCAFVPLPPDVTKTDGKDKNRINKKGEFEFKADKVEKKEQGIKMKVGKSSILTVEMGGNLKDTKVALTGSARKPLKPASDQLVGTLRTLIWTLEPDHEYVLAFRSKPMAPCDYFSLHFTIKPVEQEKEEGTNVGPDCQNHGRANQEGGCDCDVGYVGSSCSKCEEDYEMNLKSECVQIIAPPAITAPTPVPIPEKFAAQPLESHIEGGEIGWLTIVFGLGVAAIGAYVIYWLYRANTGKSRKGRYQNASGFEGPEEEEERSLQPVAGATDSV